MAGRQKWDLSAAHPHRHRDSHHLDQFLDVPEIQELFQRKKLVPEPVEGLFSGNPSPPLRKKKDMLAPPPLAAETIFQIGPLPVTNTYINSTIVLVLFLILGLLLRKRTAEVPGKLQNFVESVFEVLLGYSDRVTHDRKKSLRFFPLVGSLFFFILISNWLVIFPGIGSIGRWLVVHGEAELVPLFRPANTDLNMTLAMAVLGVVASHVFGVVAIGFWK